MRTKLSLKCLSYKHFSTMFTYPIYPNVTTHFTLSVLLYVNNFSQ